MEEGGSQCLTKGQRRFDGEATLNIRTIARTFMNGQQSQEDVPLSRICFLVGVMKVTCNLILQAASGPEAFEDSLCTCSELRIRVSCKP